MSMHPKLHRPFYVFLIVYIICMYTCVYIYSNVLWKTGEGDMWALWKHEGEEIKTYGHTYM